MTPFFLGDTVLYTGRLYFGLYILSHSARVVSYSVDRYGRQVVTVEYPTKVTFCRPASEFVRAPDLPGE